MIKPNDLKEIYQESKRLDSLFGEQNDLFSDEIIEKNILELLVEFGELANETRCFKYWSIKPMSDKEVILEEYIDCLFMILCFCNMTNVSMDEAFPTATQENIVGTFLTLYKDGFNLKKNLPKETVKQLLVNILYLADLLNFQYEDIKKGVSKKSLIIKKRFKENY